MPKNPTTPAIARRTLSWIDEDKLSFLWDGAVVIVHVPYREMPKWMRRVITLHDLETLGEINAWLDGTQLPTSPLRESKDDEDT